MSNTLLELKRPLDVSLITLLSDVDKVCQSVSVRYLLTGSMAREIVLAHVFGLAPGRATADVDFGISVANWEQFNQLRQAFLNSGVFEKDSNPSVFWSLRLGRLQVDLVPFGGIEQADGTIVWPPEDRQQMNVLGYEAALQNAWKLPITPEINVPVASMAGTVLLKLMAWRDRGLSRGGKDALDLMTVLENYDRVIGEDALFGPHQDLLVAYQFDQANTAAQILGSEVRAIADARALEVLLSLFTTEGRDKLQTNMIQGRQVVERGRLLLQAGSLLTALERGLRTGLDLPSEAPPTLPT